jgi:hypothetical protein
MTVKGDAQTVAVGLCFQYMVVWSDEYVGVANDDTLKRDVCHVKRVATQKPTTTVYCNVPGCSEVSVAGVGEELTAGFLAV